MDLDFILSVAQVGDFLEISLVTGDRLEGQLEELTLKRLALRTMSGDLVAVAISSVITARKGKAPTPSGTETAPMTTAKIKPGLPAPPYLASREFIPGLASSGKSAKPTEPPAISLALVAERLAQVGNLSVLPVDFDIYVAPASREQLNQIRNSYDYAQRVQELSPRFGRANKLYTRATYIWNAERDNPELARLMAALALLKGEVESAGRYAMLAADGGDVTAQRLLAIAAAQRGENDVVIWALLRYFAANSADSDPATWEAFVELLDAAGNRGVLAELLGSPALDETAKKTVRSALANATPAKTRFARPTSLMPRPPARIVPLTAAPEDCKADSQTQPSTQRRVAEIQDPYLRAKHLELRVRDFDAAKAAYHEAIEHDVRRESAVKDLAWLTRRLDGPEAALRVINDQYPGYVSPGNALDNILINLLTDARRYDDALVLLHKQAKRSRLTTSKRYHLTHQIAYAKLLAGKDSTSEWKKLLSMSPGTISAQRGLAMALIQRNGPGDLDRAEQLVAQHADQQSSATRSQIAALRGGGRSEGWGEQQLELLATPQFGDYTPPLVAYVLVNFSELAQRATEQRARENLPITHRDVNPLAELGRQSRDAITKAGAYISAAVLARELNDGSAQRYIYYGLTSLAESMSARQERESARDLYCAALVAADDRGDKGDRIRAALVGYLKSHSGGRANAIRKRDGNEARLTADEVSQLLALEINTHGHLLVLDLLPRLMSETSMARDVVLKALHSNEELLAFSLAYFQDTIPDWNGTGFEDVISGWHLAGERWALEQRRLSHNLSELKQIEISESGLESALARLRSMKDFGPAHLWDKLTNLTQAILELHRLFVEGSLEEPEIGLSRASGILRRLREGIARGPNSLLVEFIEPVAHRLQTLIEGAQQNLHEGSPPAPQLALALEETRAGQDGKVTIQIKVANEHGRGPLTSPELTIKAEDELFSVDEPRIALPTIRGGDHHIEVIRIKVTDRARQDEAFSMQVTLHYRPRTVEERVRVETSLPVRLGRETEFARIHNPFRDGASGVPVSNQEMFFGRDELIDNVRARLREATSPGVGVAVFGQKRAGKSSIRLHLAQRLREEDRLLVADVGNIGKLAPQHDDVSNSRVLALLMWNILACTQKDLARHYCVPESDIRLLPPGLDRQAFLGSPAPIDDCATILEEYWAAKASNPPLTVVIDEFQYIDQWMRSGLLSSSFMQAFKALIERRIFHLVIVGQAALDRLIQEDPNAFGVFSTERVTYLAEPHAERLIEIPIRIEGAPPGSQSRYREKAVSRIIELTGGSAFYIQRFCYKMVEYMNAERASLVTEADVERVHDEFLSELGVKDFDNLESPGYTDPGAFTSAEYRDVLLAIARASLHQAATMAAIQETYQGTHLQELLEDLVLRDVVRRDWGTYRIVVRLYQDWLLKSHGPTHGTRNV